MCYRCNKTASGALLGREPFARTVAGYAHNLVSSRALTRMSLRRFREVYELDLFRPMTGKGKPDARRDYGQWLRGALVAYARRKPEQRRPAPAHAWVEKNLAVVGALVGLGSAERAVLRFLFALNHSGELAELVNVFGTVTVPAGAALIAIAAHLPRAAVSAALAPDARLVESGLVALSEETNELVHKITLREGLLDVALTPRLDRDRVLARFLPEAAPPTLTAADYPSIAGELTLARRLLGAALDRRRRGVNVFLHGPTGTGKSELARLLARELRAKLHVVGLADAEGESASARQRLASLSLGNRLVGGTRALLLFDEVEDLFDWKWSPAGERAGAFMSKKWFNDLLESNAVPTLWISNRTEGIDRAFLRRFSYAIELKPATGRQRVRVLQRHLGARSRVRPAEVEAIARATTASPAQLGTAVAVARLVTADRRPDRATVERVLEPMERLVTGHGRPNGRPFDPARFRPAVLNASEDLVTLADRLAGWRPSADPGISLCLFGPPGTGKSEYVRWLAWRMDRPVIERRVSDIESCWVGETEKNIAAAFREAADEGAVLLFDEADSFLRSRGDALRSWEVTAVNELLQQLESHRGVVACTTNLWKDLDEAAMRRFVFKIELKFLTPACAADLFRATFGREPPAEIASMRSLAPGDFAAVDRHVRALGLEPHPADLLRRLRAEVAVKRSSPAVPGFGAG